MKNLLIILLFLPLMCSSQRIFVTGEKHKADFDIIYTRHLWQADICIRTVSQEYKAGRSRSSRGCDNWFFVNNIWEADYVVRVVNSIHPGRRTLFVYRDSNSHYTPPLRDRNDPRNQYDYEYDNDEYVYNNQRNDNWRPRVNIDIHLFKRF